MLEMERAVGVDTEADNNNLDGLSFLLPDKENETRLTARLQQTYQGNKQLT